MGIKLAAWQAEPARGMSFGFFFQGQVERGSLSLMTPLGSQVAQVEWAPASATLRRIGPGGGEDIRRGSIEELAEAALGEALPLQTLVHWMQGRPDPTLPHTQATEAGTFEQRGWVIDTSGRAQGRILATRQGQPGLRDARILVRLDP
jgi:outer membrane lipoprotein LolB